MKIFVIKTLSGLIPCDRTEFDKLQESKLKLNGVYEVEIKKKRNTKFHRKFFALLNICYNNQEYFEHSEDLREYLTIKAGFYRKIIMPNGYEQIKPKSISFSNMDEIEFNDFYDKVLIQVIKLLGCDSEDIINELQDF